MLHRFADTERLVEGPIVLDVVHPGLGRPARFHTLEPGGTLVWVLRSDLDAYTDVSERLAVTLEQTREERAGLAALGDRQTWVGPSTGSVLADEPYVGELDYILIGLPGVLTELVPSLPRGLVPLFDDERVVLVFGIHGPSSLFSGHNPPAEGGYGAVLVPASWSGEKGLYCASVWTGQLMYVHVLRELYGLLGREGEVYDPKIPSYPQRLMAWGRRLRLKAEWLKEVSPDLTHWEDMVGMPWDPTRLPLQWCFERHGFGVGPGFFRGCKGDQELSLLSLEELEIPRVESMDGVTLVDPVEPIYGFRLQADFRLADPVPLDRQILAITAAWLVG